MLGRLIGHECVRVRIILMVLLVGDIFTNLYVREWFVTCSLCILIQSRRSVILQRSQEQ